MDRQLKTAIIGGGPGGLTLARILQLKGFKCVTVYERDESRFIRSQGGTLDLHETTGQYALNEAQLMHKFKEHCRYEGQDTTLMDKDAVIYYKEIASDENKGRPEIERTDLRNILLDSLVPDTVKWGHSLSNLELNNGKVQLKFQNGVTAEADFVVGAEGAWSKVRQYLSREQPTYTGITLIEFSLADVDNAHPEVAKFVGRGQVFACSDGRVLIPQKNSSGIIRVYAGLQLEENFFKNQARKLDFSIYKMKAFLLEKYHGWNEHLLNLIRANSEEFTPRLIYTLPVEHSWSRGVNGRESLSLKVTLLGDAAHIMAPFAGQGANLAMKDAASLASAFESMQENFQNALVKYESEMFARSAQAAKKTSDTQKLFFAPNDEFKKILLSAKKGDVDSSKYTDST